MTVLYLDWDVSFRYWSSHTQDRATGKRSKGWMKNRLRLSENMLWFDEARLLYRRSGSGRVHVSLETPFDVGDEARMLLRTLLQDDSARVYLDIVRWCRGEDTNRLFDVKYSKGKIRRAGPWVKWLVVRPRMANPPAKRRRRTTGTAKPLPATGPR